MNNLRGSGWLDRRQFMRTAVVGLSAVAGQGGRILEAEPLGIPVGLELFTVRNECAQDFPGALEKVAAIGYKQVEVFDFYGRKPAEVRQILKSTGLVAPSSHMLAYVLRPESSPSDVRARWAPLVDEAAQLGVHCMGGSVGGISKIHPLDDYKRLADLMNVAGEQCKQAGL